MGLKYKWVLAGWVQVARPWVHDSQGNKIAAGTAGNPGTDSWSSWSGFFIGGDGTGAIVKSV